MKRNLTTSIVLGLLFFSQLCFSQDFVIFDIAQDFPMYDDDVSMKKNYYINMGETQGLSKGTTLNVYRVVSRRDPYEGKKRHNFKVKIGELEVVHSEENASITTAKAYKEFAKNQYFEVNALMIGDRVDVKIQ